MHVPPIDRPAPTAPWVRPTHASTTGGWRRDLGAGLTVITAAIAGTAGVLVVLWAATIVRTAQGLAQDWSTSAGDEGTTWGNALLAPVGSSMRLPLAVGISVLLVAAVAACAGFAVAAGRSRLPALVALGWVLLGIGAAACTTQAWWMLPIAVVPLAGVVVLGLDEAASGTRDQRAAVPV